MEKKTEYNESKEKNPEHGVIVAGRDAHAREGAGEAPAGKENKPEDAGSKKRPERS